MAHSLLLPKLGLTMTEGVLSEWLVREGDAFKEGDPLFVVESEKVATEVLAETEGTLTKILVQAGEEAAVGAVIGHWSDSSASDVTSADPDLSDHTESDGNTESEGDTESDGNTTADYAENEDRRIIDAAAEKHANPIVSDKKRIVATPLARRTAAQQGVALGSVTGSGPAGRIKAADVEAEVRRQTGTDQSQTETQPQTVRTELAPSSLPGRIDPGLRSKPDSVRAAIARRLTLAKQTVPHFYMSVDVQANALLDMHAELNRISTTDRMTLTHFVVAAVGRALKELPSANRIWSDDEIVSFESTDVGLAVNTEHGLFAPVIRGAGEASLREVSHRVRSVVAAARSGQLSQDDSVGGVIAVSNAGMYNVRYLTPIINPGQAMILGVGSINSIFRPDHNGQPVVHREIGLVLAADHRVLDGVSGLGFLNCIVSYLEHPLKLLADS